MSETDSLNSACTHNQIAAAPTESREEFTKRKEEEYQKKIELGIKFDMGKPRWELLPLDVIEQVVKILTMGAEKYKDDNWKYIPDAKERYSAALQRHFMSYWKSNHHGSPTEEDTYDKDSGLNHLFHLLCCGIFLEPTRK